MDNLEIEAQQTFKQAFAILPTLLSRIIVAMTSHEETRAFVELLGRTLQLTSRSKDNLIERRDLAAQGNNKDEAARVEQNIELFESSIKTMLSITVPANQRTKELNSLIAETRQKLWARIEPELAEYKELRKPWDVAHAELVERLRVLAARTIEAMSNPFGNIKAPAQPVLAPNFSSPPMYGPTLIPDLEKIISETGADKVGEEMGKIRQSVKEAMIQMLYVVESVIPSDSELHQETLNLLAELKAPPPATARTPTPENKGPVVS